MGKNKDRDVIEGLMPKDAKKKSSKEGDDGAKKAKKEKDPQDTKKSDKTDKGDKDSTKKKADKADKADKGAEAPKEKPKKKAPKPTIDSMLPPSDSEEEQQNQKQKQDDAPKSKSKKSKKSKQGNQTDEEDNAKPAAKPTNKNAKGNDSDAGEDVAKKPRDLIIEEIDTEAQDADKREKEADLLAKVARGEKLSNKEKRALKKMEDQKQQAELEQQQQQIATSFEVTVHETDTTNESGGLDVKVQSFSVNVGGKKGEMLFLESPLMIVHPHHYALVGPNGAGKTTLLQLVNRRQIPVPKHLSVLLLEQELAQVISAASPLDAVLSADTERTDLLERESELLAKLEDPDSQMDEAETQQVYEEYGQVCEQLASLGSDAQESNARKILLGLGFTLDQQTQPLTLLSGGWRMRVSLARALFIRPQLLMLDEPTNHLDLDAVFWLEDYLSAYPHSVVVVSHDREFLDSVSDILSLESKKVVHYRGNYSEFRDMYEVKINTLKKAVEKAQKTKAKASGKILKGREADKQEQAKQAADEIPAEYRVRFTLKPPVNKVPACSLHNVWFSFNSDGPTIVKNVTMNIDCNSRIAIVGPNGAGKSTLLRLLCKELEPTKGEVLHHADLKIGRYHQHFEDLLPADLSPVEYFTEQMGCQNPQQARQMLGNFGLVGHAHTRPIGSLSGGQKARVVLASFQLMRPHILVLDEPTNHLDIESIDALTKALNEFEGGVIVVTHDARLIRATECDLWMMNPGGKFSHYEKGFDAYKRQTMLAIQKRNEEMDAMLRKQAEENAKKRQAVVAKRKV